jgi:hypothetical protein
MSKIRNDVPTWVRSFICIVASLSVCGLVLLASFGVQITGWLAWPIVVFALQTTSLAFGRDAPFQSVVAGVMSKNFRHSE